MQLTVWSLFSLFLFFICIPGLLLVTVKTGDISGDSSSRGQATKNEAVPGNRGRLVTLPYLLHPPQSRRHLVNYIQCCINQVYTVCTALQVPLFNLFQNNNC